MTDRKERVARASEAYLWNMLDDLRRLNRLTRGDDNRREASLARADAAIAAILPPGWLAVPEVPTEAMLDAGSSVQTASGEPVGYEGASNAWAAMVASAPTPPAAAEETQS